MKDNTKRITDYIKGVFTKNLGIKLFALLLAVLLWSYVVSTTNPVRVKTINDVAIEYRGLTQLKERNLVIKNEYRAQHPTADVRLDVAQSDYLAVNSDNVTCTADFSRITAEGEQRVYLTASFSGGGDTVSISPSYITVSVEQLQMRVVPIRTQLVGEVHEGYWRNQPKLNREVLSIKGARSVVESIEYAEVVVDVSDAFMPISEPLNYALYSYDNELVEAPTLELDPGNCIVSVNILPQKLVPVELDLTGDIAEGYWLEGRSVTPAYVLIAAPKDVLSDIDSIKLPFAVDGASGNITSRAALQLPSDVQWCEYSDVAVTVNIQEVEETKTFERLDVIPFNAPEKARVSINPASVTVVIKGPRSVVLKLPSKEIQPYVDLTGFDVGDFTLVVRTRIREDMPGLDVNVVNPVVSVTIE